MGWISWTQNTDSRVSRASWTERSLLVLKKSATVLGGSPMAADCGQLPELPTALSWQPTRRLDFSPTATRNWILCELGRGPRAPERTAGWCLDYISLLQTTMNHCLHRSKCFWRAYHTKGILLINIIPNCPPGLYQFTLPPWPTTFENAQFPDPFPVLDMNVSEITNEVERLFMYLLATWFSPVKCLCIFCSLFCWIIYSFLLIHRNSW